jgi:hypothetical protein
VDGSRRVLGTWDRRRAHRGPLLREGFRDSGLLTLGSGTGAREAYLVAFLLTAFIAGSSTALGIAAGAYQLEWSPRRGMLSPNIVVAFVSDHFGLAGLLLSVVLVPLVPVYALGEVIGWRDSFWSRDCFPWDKSLPT